MAILKLCVIELDQKNSLIRRPDTKDKSELSELSVRIA